MRDMRKSMSTIQHKTRRQASHRGYMRAMPWMRTSLSKQCPKDKHGKKQ